MYARFGSTILCITLALGASGCGGGGSSPAAPSNPPPTSSPPSGNTSTITIPPGDGYGSSTFSPSNITIQAGASVTWANQDSVAHISAAANNNLWTATIEPGGSFSRIFAERGTFNYRCTIHQGMSGTVTVQ